jgi:hypothetical protein
MRQDVMDSLRFVKVIVDKAHMTESNRAAGYLSPVSCAMLVTELERDGFQIVRAPAPSGDIEGR